HKRRKLSAPLLQGMRVMATGQRTVDDPVSGERRQYATVTLDMEPEQAGALILARERGKLTALLRNPRDKSPAEGATAELLAALRDQADDAAGVPVLYGGSKLSPEGLRLGAPRADAAAGIMAAMSSMHARPGAAAQAMDGARAGMPGADKP
ncbi:MAG TPA: RcpC/CpaB family pilus assembly protein, partial [Acetobacteraceae bacterium]